MLPGGMPGGMPDINEMARKMGAVDENGEPDMEKLQELTKNMMGGDGKPDFSKMGEMFNSEKSNIEEVD